MKIYTKTGDNGQTSLCDGKRIKKNNERIKSYGTIDELNSFIGLTIVKSKINEITEDLKIIQEKLFVISTILATENTNDKTPKLIDNDILFLEKQIDKYSEFLPKLKHFIIAGGNELSALLHIARTICRRAEREIVSIFSDKEEDKLSLEYINRLSDYLFTVARKAIIDNGQKEKFYKNLIL